VSRPTAISARALSRAFDGLTAVDGLDFEIRPGELFGIVGPDGAGKTTTLRMLAGVLRPTSGTAIVAGVDVADDPEGVKPHIAYMAQRFGLYEDLTVRENLDFYADLYRVPGAERPRRLERLYAFSRLGEFEDRLAGKLSGGMKQKLSLSCCLIHRPDILLLDEPTFGVDPISRRELWLILHEMVAQGVTIVVSTSYLDEAERCDRVALLDEGRVLALDSPAALQASLPGRMLSIHADRPRPARDALRDAPFVRSAHLFGDALHVHMDGGVEDGDVRALLRSAGIEVTDVRATTPALEDVFMSLLRDRPARVDAAPSSEGSRG
jgi:ABC-2 type transport system ATP-binding protein